MDSLLFIDYDKRAFIKESFLVMHYSKGGFSQKALNEIPFDDFKLCVEEAVRIQDMQEENNDG